VNQERLADFGAAGSIVAWVSSMAVQTLPIVQWLAGVAAIVAGLCAAYYHIRRARKG
jgi:putative flippase GtrA